MRQGVLALIVLMLSLRILTQSTFANTDSPIPKVIINELIPNPDGSDTLYEWIELYNTTNSEIDLTNWKVDGSVIPEIEILPKSYLIIAKDKEALMTIYPELVNVSDVSISLLNSGETIRLEDSEGIAIDSVTYTSSTSGLSLERDGILNIGECNKLQLHIDQHSIEKKNNSVKTECWPENYSWEVEIEIPPTTFSFLLSFDGENFASEISDIGQQEIFTDIKSSDSSPFTIIKIFDELGNTLTNPFTIDNYFGKILAELQKSDGTIVEVDSGKISIYPKILITEVYASPSSSETEWLELYNPTSLQTNLAFWYLTEELDIDGKCIPTGSFPEASLINADDYFVIENNLLKVSLNNGGDQIYLCNDLHQMISKIEYPNALIGESYGLEYLGGSYSQVTELLATATKSSQNSDIKIIDEIPEEDDEEPIEEDEVVDQDPEIKSFEGVIIANYSTSFDIQTEEGVIRVGLKYLDTVIRKKGDNVKVTGEYLLDGEIKRIYPKISSDLIIIEATAENITNKDNSTISSSKTTTKPPTIKQQEAVTQLKSQSAYEYKVPSVLLIRQGADDNLFEVPESNNLDKFLSFILVGLFLFVVMVIIYICYVTKFDKKLIQLYNHWQKTPEIKYFKPRVNLDSQKDF